MKERREKFCFSLFPLEKKKKVDFDVTLLIFFMEEVFQQNNSRFIYFLIQKIKDWLIEGQTVPNFYVRISFGLSDSSNGMVAFGAFPYY